MPLIVGNLLTDPAANSFISLADATAYLTAETGLLAVTEWLAAPLADQEASLVRASRWMAGALKWCAPDLSADDVLRVGHVAARLAVTALTVDLYEATQPGRQVKRAKAGSSEVEFADAGTAQAAGRFWPWLYPMLRGLVCDPNSRGIGFMVI